MKAIRGSRRSFGLIELVIVVVIIAVTAAIALPRMSHGARSAGANALKADLNGVYPRWRVAPFYVVFSSALRSLAMLWRMVVSDWMFHKR